MESGQKGNNRQKGECRGMLLVFQGVSGLPLRGQLILPWRKGSAGFSTI